MKLKVQLTKEDLFKYSLFNLTHSKSVLMIYVLSIFLLFLALWGFTQGESFSQIIWALYLPFASFIVVPILIVLKITFLYKKEKDRFFYKNYELNKEGVRISNDYFDSTIKWSFIKKVRETKHAFLLFIDKKQAHMIPFHSFQDKKQKEELRKMFKEVLEKDQLILQ
ncbi:YcxB family protein [Patescibacteria group bacterium]|nr:YcxB family protein [Patescibacteria group bacterium]MBU1721987.1 YcxB family protein [Patescibacteria group bacterium]MBU1901264.1 YcxB family protein [Patescibacteria group bacterium]